MPNVDAAKCPAALSDALRPFLTFGRVLLAGDKARGDGGLDYRIGNIDGEARITSADFAALVAAAEAIRVETVAPAGVDYIKAGYALGLAAAEGVCRASLRRHRRLKIEAREAGDAAAAAAHRERGWSALTCAKEIATIAAAEAAGITAEG